MTTLITKCRRDSTEQASDKLSTKNSQEDKLSKSDIREQNPSINSSLTQREFELL